MNPSPHLHQHALVGCTVYLVAETIMITRKVLRIGQDSSAVTHPSRNFAQYCLGGYFLPFCSSEVSMGLQRVYSIAYCPTRTPCIVNVIVIAQGVAGIINIWTITRCTPTLADLTSREPTSFCYEFNKDIAGVVAGVDPSFCLDSSIRARRMYNPILTVHVVPANTTYHEI
ncbi:hypothetical protein J6590_018055 [Homalodisca vitripennis]|nr:hypothetical protein J6590_018055 [Homalodisca vitripennis]